MRVDNSIGKAKNSKIFDSPELMTEKLITKVICKIL